jgi:hypothetical protein
MQNSTIIKKVGYALLFALSACVVSSKIYAQTTDTIGNESVLTNTYGPFKITTAAASTISTKMVHLYTQGELAVGGIVPGSTIHSLSWYKAVQPTIQNGYSVTLNVGLRDQVSAISYGTSSTSTTYITNYVDSTFTMVAASTFTSANLIADSGWVTVTLTTPFTYTGGSLEVYTNGVITSGTGIPASVAINWKNTNSAASNIYPALYSNSPATYNGTATIFNGRLRPNVIFNYTPGPNCTGTPSTGVISMDTIRACPGMLSGHLKLTGTSSEGGISVQWQKKAQGDLVFSNVSTTSAFALFNQSVTVPTEYRVNVTCSVSGTMVTSPVFSMLPTASIVPNYMEDFNFPATWVTTTIPNCWEGRKGLMDYPVSFLSNSAGFTAGAWASDGWNNTGTVGAAKIRTIASAYDWFLTPIVDLGTGNYQLDFDLGVFNFNATGAGVMDSDDEFDVVISTDGGATFSQADIIKQVNATNTTFPLANGTMHITVPLTGYSGNIKLGFYGTGGSLNPTPASLSPDVMIDNVQIIPFGTVLPVKMDLLEAVINKNGNGYLTWKTYSEENNTGFTVQKSTDGKNFRNTDNVASKAINGNSNFILNYNFVDAEHNNAEVYYRIVQTDKDGSSTYSNIVKLYFGEDSNQTIDIFPNPVKDEINIHFYSAMDNTGILTVTNLMGNVLMKESHLNPQMKLNISNLPSGIYFMNVTCQNRTTTHKIIKL